MTRWRANEASATPPAAADFWRVEIRARAICSFVRLWVNVTKRMPKRKAEECVRAPTDTHSSVDAQCD